MPTTIIGVDYSGAKADNKTWIAQGSLTDDGTLRVDYARNIRRAELCELLLNIKTPAVAAMDFPFCVPVTFATRLCAGREPTSMPEVWQAIANITTQDFINARRQFVGDYGDPKLADVVPPLPADTLYCCTGEPHRAGDVKYLSGPFSPLHNANPSMPQMTYHGIRMLNRLYNHNPDGHWYVPPLEPTARPEHTVTLLETMPGAFLQVCGLPSRGYKTGGNARTLRRNILDRLPTRSGWPEIDLAAVRGNCLANDDCLDAVVAFVCAASWARCPAHFHHPTADELAAARREGWIYVPKSVGAHLAA